MTLPAYAMNRENFPEMYERMLVGWLFRPWVDALFERAHLAPGDALLDIACGTGIVARTAKERLGGNARVVGVDVSAGMLAVARSIAPGVDWREGNAAALPVTAGETFDVVTCQQGLQFFPDRPAAAREMRRVLAPRGRVAIATWLPLRETPFFRDLHQIGERHVGTIDDQRHAFGVARDLEALLAGAGFRDVRVETVTRTMRSAADPAVFFQMNAMALVGMSAAGKAMTEDDRSRAVAAIAEESATLLPRYGGGAQLVFDLSTNIATARV